MQNLIVMHEKLGQSVWLDHIGRTLVTDGGLDELVRIGLRGMTANPAVFQESLRNSDAYDSAILNLLQADPEIDPETLYFWLMVQDVQLAADALHPVWLESEAQDGYVCVDLSPLLATDTQGLIEAAQHLWREVHHDNLMINVPATDEGMSAIEELAARNIPVNVTMLFSLDRYNSVVEAWLRGMERCEQPRQMSSAATFFISRFDARIDNLLESHDDDAAHRLKGRTGIAMAKSAYRVFNEKFAMSRFEKHAERGIRPQRLLWHTNSADHPNRTADLFYVENLIGSQTIHAIEPETLDLLQRSGITLRQTLLDTPDQAQHDLDTLETLGISLTDIGRELEQEAIEMHRESYTALLDVLDRKRYEVSQHYAE